STSSHRSKWTLGYVLRLKSGCNNDVDNKVLSKRRSTVTKSINII
ncbi:unnamed protein product, partial [Rotaria sordida]